MRISISVTNYDGADLREIARAADEAGVDTLWVTDHLIQADPHASPDGAMLEAYTTLGYLAAVSERVRLGAMVSPVTFREPALLVKAVTTLDVLSGGRAWLGTGAGYQQDEAAALGLPLPPTADRFERLDETLRIALAMWAGDQQPIHGAHYQLTHPTSYPPPATRPHPPILIGGRLRRSMFQACRARHRPCRGHHHRTLDTCEDRHAHRRDARLTAAHRWAGIPAAAG